MDILKKIKNSRDTLKTYLDKEWDTSVISNFSVHEIEKLYSLKTYKNPLTFGKASNLNITLSHLKIKDHKLHIIYYNFPELNSNPLKITKNCGDKMYQLYVDEIIQPEDSIILIITEPITENIEKTIENIYKKGQEELLKTNLSNNIMEQNEKLGKDKYNLSHFRNIHILNLNNLDFDIGKHMCVPHHKCIRTQSEIEKIYENTNSSSAQLPKILRTDPMAKLLRMAPGDICEIERISDRCGEYKYYRICE